MRLRHILTSAGLATIALTGCSSHSNPTMTRPYIASVTALATPAPAATPSAMGTCTLQQASQPFDPNTSQYTSPTYTVTVTNSSTVPDDISQISTVFYSEGTEAGSDQQDANGVIAPGQSLSWTFDIPANLIGTPEQIGTVTSVNDGGAYWNNGDPLEIVNTLATSCQFEQWG